ncbi:MAG: hypothetical protein ACK5XX_07950 [Holosporales bacterium]
MSTDNLKKYAALGGVGAGNPKSDMMEEIGNDTAKQKWYIEQAKQAGLNPPEGANTEEQFKNAAKLVSEAQRKEYEKISTSTTDPVYKDKPRKVLDELTAVAQKGGDVPGGDVPAAVAARADALLTPQSASSQSNRVGNSGDVSGASTNQVQGPTAVSVSGGVTSSATSNNGSFFPATTGTTVAAGGPVVNTTQRTLTASGGGGGSTSGGSGNSNDTLTSVIVGGVLNIINGVINKPVVVAPGSTVYIPSATNSGTVVTNTGTVYSGTGTVLNQGTVVHPGQVTKSRQTIVVPPNTSLSLSLRSNRQETLLITATSGAQDGSYATINNFDPNIDRVQLQFANFNNALVNFSILPTDQGNAALVARNKYTGVDQVIVFNGVRPAELQNSIIA